MSRQVSLQANNSLRITLRRQKPRRVKHQPEVNRMTIISDSMCRGLSKWLPADEQVHGGATPNTLRKMIWDGEVSLEYETIILHVGTNMMPTCNGEWWKVADSVIDLAYFIRTQVRPGTRIFFLSILPRPVDHRRTWSLIQTINGDLQRHFGRRFISCSWKFSQRREELYNGSRLHLNTDGKRILARYIREDMMTA